MSVTKFAEAFRKLVNSSGHRGHERDSLSAVAEQIVDTTKKLEERSKRHKEERERGARITKHRTIV